MKRYFPIVILLGCAAAFAFGIFRLFEFRFEAGDVYPPYSSLRSDPLGAMALYESLEKIPGTDRAPRFQRIRTVCPNNRTRFICTWPETD